MFGAYIKVMFYSNTSVLLLSQLSKHDLNADQSTAACRVGINRNIALSASQMCIDMFIAKIQSVLNATEY